MIRFKSIRLSLIICGILFFVFSGLISYVTFFILAHFFESLRHITYVTLLISTLTSVILAAILFVLFSVYITAPLRKVIDGTKEVSKGNLDIHSSTDEKKLISQKDVDDLILNFNLMVDELSSIQIFRDDFINEFSHEFKTPIHSIVGYAKQLQYEDLEPEERDLYISIIISESQRLSDLSSSILNLNKLETQALVTDQVNFALDEQIRNVILLMQNDWEEKNIELDIDLDEIQIYGNEELLKQVWINLFNNAIKFSDKNSTISISCHQNENIEVTFKDNGIGMNEDVIAHMYDRFYKGDSSRSTKGNGLGLSLVKRIVDLYNGNIEVESKESVGTSIKVILPTK